jgi:hypothetical protein
MKIQVRSTFLLLLNLLVLEKLRHQNNPTRKTITDLVVSVIVNHEKHLLRAPADTGANSSSSILEAYSSKPSIKKDDSNTTTWSAMGDLFGTTKTGKCL